MLKSWKDKQTESNMYHQIDYDPYITAKQQPTYPYVNKDPYYTIDVTQINNEPTSQAFEKESKHIHVFTGVTTSAEGHDHQFTGTTEPAKSDGQHTHRYLTVTEFEKEHRHVLEGVTGPAISLPDGGHTHEIKGVTVGYTSHQHYYEEYTSIYDGK